MGAMAARCDCHGAGTRPGGRLTFLGAQESKQRNRPCSAALPSVGFPPMLGTRGRTQLASLRSARTRGAKSVFEARCARASGSCASRRLHKGNAIRLAAHRRDEAPALRRPWRRCVASRPGFGPLVQPPRSAAAWDRERSEPRELASRPLSERSVAQRVGRGAQVASIAGHPTEGRAAEPGSPFFAYFLWRSKESESPAGASPGTVANDKRSNLQDNSVK